MVNLCLAYDASVSDPGTLVPLGRTLDLLVSDTACHILQADHLPPKALQQLRLSRERGGCSLRSAEDRCYTAFMAAAVRVAPTWNSGRVRSIVSVVQETQSKLLEMGLRINRQGMPANAEEPSLIFPDDVQQPMPKRQKAWWDALEQLRHQTLADQFSQRVEGMGRLESCGGPEGGAFLRGTTADGVSSIGDSHFVLAVRFRLGLTTMPSMACQHRPRGSQRVCGGRADPLGHHAVTCKTGGAPYALHGQGCHILMGAMQQAGYQTLREQVIPELATSECKTPVLDLEGWSTRAMPRLLVDFTVRHPTAARYRQSDGCNASATVVAEREKQQHYPTRAGLGVTVAAMEVYGRFGHDLTCLLEQLSDLAQQRDRAFGHKPGRWLHRWRVQLSHATACFLGRAIQQALVPAARQ